MLSVWMLLKCFSVCDRAVPRIFDIQIIDGCYRKVNHHLYEIEQKIYIPFVTPKYVHKIDIMYKK